MTVSHNKLVGLVALLALVLILPLAVLLVKSRQDIRPRALLSAANFKLNTPTTDIPAGNAFAVMVSVEIPNASVHTSGVDFTLLYDNTKLKVLSISPLKGNNFTDIPVQMGTGAGPFVYPSEGSGKYNFLRVAMVSKNPDAQLATGTIQLANITFQALDNINGQALIKFPDDNGKLQVVGK